MDECPSVPLVEDMRKIEVLQAPKNHTYRHTFCRQEHCVLEITAKLQDRERFLLLCGEVTAYLA